MTRYSFLQVNVVHLISASVILALPFLVSGCASSGGALHYEWAPEKEVTGTERATEHPSGNPPVAAAGQREDQNGDEPDRLSDDAGLEEMVAFALERNPDVRRAFERWQGSLERAPQERALPDPQLTYGYFVARTAERQGMMGRQRVSITQMFPWFGTLDARGGAAEERAHAEAYRLEAETNRIVAEIRKQYAEYYYVEVARGVFEEHRAILAGLRDAIEASYEAAVVDLVDILRIESELDRVTEQARSLDERRKPVRAELNRLLGRTAGAPLPEPLEWERFHPEDEELRDLARQIYRHPEMRARESELRGAEEAIRLAGNRSRPDFMVGAEVLERRDERTEGMLMFGMSLPVWRESYAAARREARAERRETAAGREALALDLEARFAQAVFGLRDAERQLRLLDESLIPRAEATFEIIEGAYMEGETGFVELTGAQRDLLDLREGRARALADQSQRFAELLELAGHGAPQTAGF